MTRLGFSVSRVRAYTSKTSRRASANNEGVLYTPDLVAKCSGLLSMFGVSEEGMLTSEPARKAKTLAVFFGGG